MKINDPVLFPVGVLVSPWAIAPEVIIHLFDLAPPHADELREPHAGCAVELDHDPVHRLEMGDDCINVFLVNRLDRFGGAQGGSGSPGEGLDARKRMIDRHRDEPPLHATLECHFDFGY